MAPAFAGNGVRSWSLDGGLLLLHLNNTLDAVEDGRQCLVAFCERHAVPAKTANRLEVIFEELVSNVLRHGFGARSDQSIRVRLAFGAGLVELTVEDDGVPFDPLADVAETGFRSLETARVGGLGIPLVVKLSASARYEPGDGARPAAHAGFWPHNRLTVTLDA